MQCDENCIVVVEKQASSAYPPSIFPATSSKQETSNESQSGLLVNYKHGFVITSAVIFTSQINGCQLSKGTQPKNFLTPKDFGRTKITIILQNKSKNDTQTQFVSVPGKLFLLWRCKDFNDAMCTNFSERDGWKFREIDDDDRLLTENSQKMIIEPVSLKSDVEVRENLIFWFAMIKLEPTEQIKSIGNKILQHSPSVNLRQGETLLACGTPFGALCPPVFMNSMSTGIVTNLAGRDNALIMTDARVMPGSEGAGLYVLPHGDVKQRKLVGMIVSALCWKVNEWIGLTLAVSISALLDSLQKLSHLTLPDSLLPAIADNDLRKDRWTPEVKNAVNSVVYVQVGAIWGSGVIVGEAKGYVITCRHVVKNSKTRGVRIFIRYPRAMWIAADVVFSTCSGSPVDLALLKLKHCPDGLPAVKPATTVDKGESVIAVGYALFSFEVQKQPSVTSGIVSNTVTHQNQLVMVQSTCAVHGGASGGALLCAETGRLVGIIASNSRDVESNASFPHVNFSIPAAMFWLPIQAYIQSADLYALDTLNSTDSRIRHLWQLDAPEINIASKL